MRSANFAMFASLTLFGCASGGGSSGGSGPSTNPPAQPAQASSEPSPCGTINGRPVQCVPTQRRLIDERMAQAEAEIRKMPVDTFVALYGYRPYWASSSASKGSDFHYQSFGMWEEQIATDRRDLTVWSQGLRTPGKAMPTSGAANFTGRLMGVYVSPVGAKAGAAASLNVEANFSSRSLEFASSGTTVAGNPAPQLDLRGTLTYGAGQSRFGGSVANASGSVRGSAAGHFYGPGAEELGGTFSASGEGSERFVGAYGAKR